MDKMYVALVLLAVVYVVVGGAFFGWLLFLVLGALHIMLPYWACAVIAGLSMVIRLRG